ncbi:MAG: hypothetical protein NTU83_09380, partial [Candidatus Hydrogenedentes bacterium]|nr:hypothetical protein [Candidatus Hydrogenedentota bacterium]
PITDFDKQSRAILHKFDEILGKVFWCEVGIRRCFRCDMPCQAVMEFVVRDNRLFAGFRAAAAGSGGRTLANWSKWTEALTTGLARTVWNTRC